MTTLTEKRHTGEFILSEANGQRSRETVTIKSGEDLEAGTVLGKITATSKYVAYDNDSGDGSEVAFAVLIGACDATGGDTEAAVIARHAEVNGNCLVWKDASPSSGPTAGTADLLTVGIIVRN